MTLSVEMVVAVSLMMAVFSAVAAVGTSLVLGAGFERLRNGFEVVKKQTGFFSDAIHKLEQKVEVVDEQTNVFNETICELRSRVEHVDMQASSFEGSVKALEKKVEIVDKQSGFFSTALHELEQRLSGEEQPAAEGENHIGIDNTESAVKTGKADALMARAEDLLGQMTMLSERITGGIEASPGAEADSDRFALHLFQGGSTEDEQEIRYH